MKRWMCSDYHFFHSNIIKYCNRPFKDVYEMNEVIIKKHNERVKSNDEVFFLGDFGFFASRNRAFRGEGEPYNPEDILKKMNGHWVFCRGNHDKPSNKFKIKTKEIILEIAKMDIQLIHNPKFAKIEYPLILSGHVHNSWKVKELYYLGKKSLIINCSVDVWNFYPVSWDEIQGIYLKWKKGASIFELNKWKGQN